MNTIRFLRSMAWERAKGELNSISGTYLQSDEHKYNRFTEKLDKFINEIEDESLTE